MSDIREVVKVMATLERRFKSGNSVPVESTRITKEEFLVIADCLEYVDLVNSKLICDLDELQYDLDKVREESCFKDCESRMIRKGLRNLRDSDETKSDYIRSIHKVVEDGSISPHQVVCNLLTMKQEYEGYN